MVSSGGQYGERRTMEIQKGPGQLKQDLATPALLLDLDVFEANLKRMASHARGAHVSLRPHSKSHKCPEIAKRQIAAGAVGVCVTTIREAENMSAGGVDGLLITSEMVGKNRIERLVRLTREHPDTMSVVDNPAHATELSAAAMAGKVYLNVMVDLDLGLKRTGVAGVTQGLDLAEKVMTLPNLRLRGLHAYSSMSAHVIGFDDRRAHSHKAMEPALDLFSQMRERGMPAEILTGGSTGTYNIDTELEGVSELQPGSYVFMDVDYFKIGGRFGPLYNDFGFSLKVMATVVSKNHQGFATVDAGFKAFATDRPFGPELRDAPEVVYHFGGDEHGILEFPHSDRGVRLGDRLEFVVPHCDPTVNLYDRIYCVREDAIEGVWTIKRGYD
ncbi:MAG TPA: DSD1 family PLP-dependent enzyme [Blastocatellia bacterium]|nr:DSD1 family PLP-dependent enzyme [Blastocatellia bacterium]